MDLEYEIDHDSNCPKCGHSPMHSRDCNNFCTDGFKDEYDDDPINFLPGECLIPCNECNGTGVEIWCPGCGENLSGKLELLERKKI